MCREKQTYGQSTSYNSFCLPSLLLLVGVLKEGFSKHCDFNVINFSSIKSCLSCNDFCPSRTFCKTACCCCNKLTMSGFESWTYQMPNSPIVYVLDTHARVVVQLIHWHHQNRSYLMHSLLTCTISTIILGCKKYTRCISIFVKVTPSVYAGVIPLVVVQLVRLQYIVCDCRTPVWLIFGSPL